MTSRGVTLVELLVTLVVLGMTTSLTAIAVVQLRKRQEPTSAAILAMRRDSAAHLRTAITWVDSTGALTTVLPDGRILGRLETTNAR